MNFRGFTGVFLVAVLLVSFADFALGALPTSDDAEVEAVENMLNAQAAAWNNNNLEGFMEGYWKSPILTFSSGGKTTRGWQQTLDSYRKGYPSGGMGMLTFDNLETTLLGSDVALVLGQWHLKFSNKDQKEKREDRDGNFSLVLRKLEGSWKIIHDHSSLLKPIEEKKILGSWIEVEPLKYERFDKARHGVLVNRPTRGPGPQSFVLTADNMGTYRVLSPTDNHGDVAIKWTLNGRRVTLTATETGRGAKVGNAVVIELERANENELTLTKPLQPYLR